MSTAEEILARVRDLQPLIARNAAVGEQERRVVDESITALTEAGAFRFAAPSRYGGAETSMRTLLDLSSAVAEADGGTSWVVTLSNATALTITKLFPERAQDEVWAENPDAKLSGTGAPTATSTKVDGGLRVTGRWGWNSGSYYSDWAILGIPIPNDSGKVVGFALIPRTELDFEETWFMAGMKSSGSNTLIATDVFVPDHRIVASDPDDRSMSNPPAFAGVHPVVAGPQLGLARKALEIVVAAAATKPVAMTIYKTQADSVGFQLQLAEAAMLIETAHLHAYRAADDVDTAGRDDLYPDVLVRARVRADTARVLECVTKAIDLLITAHGASGFAESHPLQRIWRDSASAARHALTAPAVNYEVYGKALLGRDDQIVTRI